jgi:hypothetical protein
MAGGAELFPTPAPDAGSSAEAIADAVIAGIVERDGGRFSDDVAVLVFRVDDGT